MDDQHRDSQATTSSPQASIDETPQETTTATTVARMLANPRRVRRA